MNKYLILIATLFLVGCSQTDDTEDQKVDDVITVSLILNGDIDSSNSPMTRAETDSKDLIGIAVYKGGSKFAYGVFDNMDDVKINLLAGSKYIFKCTAIKDAKDKIYYKGPYPFGNTTINVFGYSTNFSDNLSNDNVSTGSGKYDYGKNKPIDRFYGELSDYTPTVNGSVNINLRRVSLGIKVKVTGITDGSVEVKCNYGGATVLSKTGIDSDYETTGEMYSMGNIYNAWKYADTDYQEQCSVSVKWTRGVGIAEDLGTKNVYVKRNRMNIIHIKLSADDGGASVGVREESGDMLSENETL